jgi:leader peptidase (prepilin peptidase)/N-methyltransferase
VTAAIYPFLFVFGAVAGSFAVTAGMRFSQERVWSHGRSYCDHCLHPLGYSQTLPVVSFARYSGRCAFCGGAIDPWHLVGELIGAIALPVVAMVFSPVYAILIFLLTMILLSAAAIDAKIRRLPDVLTGLSAMICMVLAWLTSWTALAQGLIAAAITVVVGLALRKWSGRNDRPAALGLGDVKLAAGLALWLGPLLPWAIALASIFGLMDVSIRRPPDRRISFGPYLAATGLALGAWGAFRRGHPAL